MANVRYGQTKRIEMDVFPGPLKKNDGFKSVMKTPLSDAEWFQIRGMVIGTLVSVLLKIVLSPITEPEVRHRIVRRVKR
jgi:hypothetical protein